MSTEPKQGKYVPISQCHAQVMQDLGLDYSNEVANRDMWYRWILQYQVDYRVPVQWGDYLYEGTVDDCTVPKPSNFMNLREAFFINVPGVPDFPIQPRFKSISDRRVYSNRSGEELQFTNSYEIVEREYVFETSSNANGSTLRLRYNGLYFDENGEPVVDLTYYDAIRDYCWMNWARISVAQNKQGAMSTFNLAKQNFYQSNRNVKSTATMAVMGRQQLQQIAAILNDPKFVKLNPFAVQEKQRNIDHATRGYKTTLLRAYPAAAISDLYI